MTDLTDLWRIHELDGNRTLEIENAATHQEICSIQLPYVDVEEEEARCRMNAELIRILPFMVRATLGEYNELELAAVRRKLKKALAGHTTQEVTGE